MVYKNFGYKVKNVSDLKLSSIEFSLDLAECHFIVVAGKHINGAFCSIVNFGVAAELSSYDDDVYYNAEKIFYAFKNAPNGWLPKDENRLFSIAYKLSEVVTEKLSSVEYDHPFKLF